MRPIFAGTAELTEAPTVAVVIDVMRAFTEAARAFARGAERIVFAETLEEALELKDRHPGWLAFQRVSSWPTPPRPCCGDTVRSR